MAAIRDCKRCAVTITGMFAACTFIRNTVATPRVDVIARADMTKKTTG